MKSILSLPIACTAMLFVSACASTPDPAEICSAEWIAPRTERAVTRIEKRAKSSIKALSNASESWAQGKTPGPFQMFALSNAFKKLEKELTQGQGIKDLKTVSRTCNDPDIISDALSDVMRRQGVSDQFIDFVAGNPIYQNILDELNELEVVASNS